MAVRIMSSRPAGLLVAGFLPSPAMPYARRARALNWYPTTVPSYHLELISALLVTLKSQTSSLGRMGWVAAAIARNPFFLPPFSQSGGSASVAARPSQTSVGVWSRRPQLLRSFCSLHSGYSGRVKDSSFRARRAHDECRLSAEPLPSPPHGSILSQAPRRRSAPHRYPHRYPSTVSTTARSLPRLLSATATPALWWLQLNVRMVDNN